MVGLTPIEKGNVLENAVRRIESAILHPFPEFTENPFRIESKKILTVAGVRHEVDIHVTVIRPAGYDAVFVFECKNWQEKVGKNEIIVFSEKIKVLNAQRGFFIARSYTADARAQAALDTRIELLDVAEFDASSEPRPFDFHGIQIGQIQVHIHLDILAPKSKAFPIDLESASCSLDCAEIKLKEYVAGWLDQVKESRCSCFSSETASEGAHLLEFHDERQFEANRLVINGQPVRSISLGGTIQVHVYKGIVVSAFEIAKRGRCITIQVAMPIAQIKSDFVELPSY